MMNDSYIKTAEPKCLTEPYDKNEGKFTLKLLNQVLICIYCITNSDINLYLIVI